MDELGDVLFQVLFLSLLLEERGEGDLAAVAEACAAKLIRRHPHVYGERDLESAGEVLAQWEEIKREVEGGGDREPLAGLPENLPALLYARKVLRRLDPGGSSGEEKPGGPASDPETRARRSGWSANSCSRRWRSPASWASTPSWRSGPRPGVSPRRTAENRPLPIAFPLRWRRSRASRGARCSTRGESDG